MNPNQLFQNLILASGVIALSFLATACSDTNSTNIKTSGLYAEYSINGGNSSTVECQAIFQVGGGTGTYVNLDNGDGVTCNGQTMNSSTNLFGQIIYSISIPASSSGVYTLNLNRTGEGAYSSAVTLPPPIVGTSPSNGTNIKKGTALAVSWAPNSKSATSMNVYLNYSLTTPSGTEYADFVTQSSYPETGSANFLTTDTQSSPPIPGTWPATLNFVRHSYGTMDSRLRGTISAVQTALVNINLVE